MLFGKELWMTIKALNCRREEKMVGPGMEGRIRERRFLTG